MSKAKTQSKICTSRDGVKHTDILIGQFMAQANSLRLMFHRLAEHDGHPEMLDNRLVNGIALERLVATFGEG